MKKFILNIDTVYLLMASRGLTVSGLAEKYGCSRSRMHMILNQRTVTPIVLGKLAEALGVKPANIVKNEVRELI